MAPMTPIGSFQTARRLCMPIMFAVGEVALPGELVDHLRRPAQRLLERPVELRREGHHARRADLGDELLAVLLALGLERLLQLLEAALAQGAVGRPVGLVEGPPGRGDRPLHVLGGGVGHLAEHLLRRRVDVLEPLARSCLDELAVDEHAHLAGRALGGHAVPLPCLLFFDIEVETTKPRLDRSRPPPGSPWRRGTATARARRDIAENLGPTCRFRRGPFDALPE